MNSGEHREEKAFSSEAGTDCLKSLMASHRREMNFKLYVSKGQSCRGWMLSQDRFNLIGDFSRVELVRCAVSRLYGETESSVYPETCEHRLNAHPQNSGRKVRSGPLHPLELVVPAFSVRG